MYLKITLSRAESYINKFVRRDKDHQYLAFFRTAVGLIALADVVTMGRDFRLFFSEDSTIIPQELSYLFTEYFHYLNPVYSIFREANELPLFYSGVFWSYIISLIALMLGFKSRFFAFTSLILQLIIFKSFALFNFGYDHFLTMSFFYCMVFPTGKISSVDNWISSRKNDLNYNFNYQNILRVHLAIVYLFAGLAKIISVTWWNGEAIWRSISSIYDNLFKIPPLLLAIAGIITLILEVGYPFLMSSKKTRDIALFGVLSMHFGIAFLLQLPLFAGIMIVWNITAYYEYIKQWFKK